MVPVAMIANRAPLVRRTRLPSRALVALRSSSAPCPVPLPGVSPGSGVLGHGSRVGPPSLQIDGRVRSDPGGPHGCADVAQGAGLIERGLERFDQAVR